MKIITAGDNCIDFYVKTGEMFPGGNPVNVAVYLRRYVEDVSYIGCVGADDAGKKLVSSLESRGVDVSRVRVIKNGKTAVTKVEHREGDRVFLGYNPGTNKDFCLLDMDLEYIYEGDAFITGFWGNCQNRLAEIKAHSVITAFDFSDKIHDPLWKETAEYVDYAFFSWPEEYDLRCIKDFMKLCYETGTKTVVVTLGKYGSIAYNGKKYFNCGIIDCPVVDTMGAGDSFIAGFVSSILENEDIEAAMHRGTESSTVTIQYAGAW